MPPIAQTMNRTKVCGCIRRRSEEQTGGEFICGNLAEFTQPLQWNGWFNELCSHDLFTVSILDHAQTGRLANALSGRGGASGNGGIFHLPQSFKCSQTPFLQHNAQTSEIQIISQTEELRIQNDTHDRMAHRHSADPAMQIALWKSSVKRNDILRCIERMLMKALRHSRILPSPSRYILFYRCWACCQVPYKIVCLLGWHLSDSKFTRSTVFWKFRIVENDCRNLNNAISHLLNAGWGAVDQRSRYPHSAPEQSRCSAMNSYIITQLSKQKT